MVEMEPCDSDELEEPEDWRGVLQQLVREGRSHLRRGHGAVDAAAVEGRGICWT